MIVLGWNAAGFCVLKTAPLKLGHCRGSVPQHVDSANAIESFSQQ
jgi:hypothetical protein